MTGNIKLSNHVSLQETAINLLATGYTVSDVARILEIDSSTVRRWWVVNPLFKPAVEALKQQAASQPDQPDNSRPTVPRKRK